MGSFIFFVSFFFQKPSLEKKKGREDFAGRFLGNELAHGNA